VPGQTYLAQIVLDELPTILRMRFLDPTEWGPEYSGRWTSQKHRTIATQIWTNRPDFECQNILGLRIRFWPCIFTDASFRISADTPSYRERALVLLIACATASAVITGNEDEEPARSYGTVHIHLVQQLEDRSLEK
jgi:hypothetical protein